MSHKEYSTNYIYILNYEYVWAGGNKMICLHALDTHYMVACTINKDDLIDLANSRKVMIRNINDKGVCNVVDKDKKVVLFKCDKDNYMVADYYCNLSVLTLQQIKEDRDNYPDVQFVGRGITTISGKVPNINKRAMDIYRMQNFNNKAAMIGVSTLDFDFDYNNDLIITGIRNETDKVQIPHFATHIANRAFVNSNIKHVNIGNNTIDIGSNAFAGCLMLESVELGDSVEVIGDRAFFRCQNLKKLKINDNLKEIQPEAFAYSGVYVLNRGTRNKTIKVNDEIREMLQMFR